MDFFDDEGYEDEPYINEDEEPQIAEEDVYKRQVVENLTAGTEQRVSKRLEDAELVKPVEPAAPSEALSAEEQKRCRCAVSSVSFRRNTPRITTHSRPRKRPSQKRKGQKIHPRM